MIQSRDRRYYIGASDTAYVMGNWNTKTWRKWYMEKLGLGGMDITTKPMRVGNAYEHRIIDFVAPEATKDEQVLVEYLGLRVNYDAIDGNTIYEVKTYSSDEFKVSKRYYLQAQAEILAAWLSGRIENPKLYIVAYKVTEDEYLNYFRDIDSERITKIEIKEDSSFPREYLKRLKILHEAIIAGRMPCL